MSLGFQRDTFGTAQVVVERRLDEGDEGEEEE
jgi:hypothetical protein